MTRRMKCKTVILAEDGAEIRNFYNEGWDGNGDVLGDGILEDDLTKSICSPRIYVIGNEN